MNDAEYRKLDAINYSSLKHIRKSPKHYRHHIDNPEPENHSKYAELRAVHALLLEPFDFDENFAVYDGRRDSRVKEYKDFLATVNARTVITPAERDRAQRVADAFRSNPQVESLLSDEGTHYEVAMVWDDPETGLKCKGKADVINRRRLEDGRFNLVIGDVKTFYSTDAATVARHARQNGWYEQLAHYTRGALIEIERDFGVPADQVQVFWLSIIAEQSAPHDVTVIEWGARTMAAAQAELSRWLRLVADCTASGEWPGRGEYVEHDADVSYTIYDSAEPE